MQENPEFGLREMRESDLALVLGWRNAERIRANMYTDHVISMEEHRAWFARTQPDPTTVNLICEHYGIPIGLVNFVQIDRKNGKAFWGFYLGEEQGPRGRGSAMEFLALDFAFTDLDLRKLCCEVFSFNQPVVRLHEKFGFREEGCFRKHVLKNGAFEDVVALAIFREDWDANRERMAKLCFRNKGKS